MVQKEIVCYYDHQKIELFGSQKSKAKKFVREGCIKQKRNGQFVCLPIKGYNTREYELTYNSGIWSCNCQCFAINKRQCSHLGALFLYLQTNNTKEIPP